jgi:glyoxylase-like metal-dependent hydrolase (beta-lactamase superfamily II)
VLGGQYNPGAVAELVHRIASGVGWIDLQFLGVSHRIGCGVYQSPAGLALVDPGPTSCLPRLESALTASGASIADVSHLVLTHIHLDHAGAVGTILRRAPRARVVVHRRGAGHLVDPSKLLASATRLYGADMDRLWGACEPAPADRLDIVDGGEVLSIAGQAMEVAYTPGHASHHVSYLDRDADVAWVGDTAGVCIQGGYVLPPTPPPDIDIELWLLSLERIAAWRPGALFLTHCGLITEPQVHLQTMGENLVTAAAWARESLDLPGEESERQAAFDGRIRRDLRKVMAEERAVGYESMAGVGLMWPGLARYWRKQPPGGPG